MRGFWNGIDDDDDPNHSVERRFVWNGVGVFGIQDQDIAHAPFEPVKLRIKLRMQHRTSRISEEQTGHSIVEQLSGR